MHDGGVQHRVSSLEVIREAHVSNWQGFLDDLEIADECVHQYENPYGKPGMQMTVMNMYRSSYNWPLHVRLDMTYRVRGVLEPDF